MRPKAVVFVGNGFTISLSQQLGIFDWHDTRSLLPPHGPLEWIQEASTRGSVRPLPVWHEDRYPQLWVAWQDFVRKGGNSSASPFNSFCETVSGQTFPQGDSPTGSFLPFHTGTIGFQLRRYLWHCLFELTHRFRSVLESADDAGRSWPFPLFRATARWPLATMLCELAEFWDLTIVSFNYEHYLEEVLKSHGCTLHHLRLAHAQSRPEPRPGAVLIIHPHGELATQSPIRFGSAFGFDDAMIGLMGDLALIHQNLGHAELEYEFPPPQPCPDIPDLVPPGHDDSHLIGARSRNRDTIRFLVGRADLIGSIGFSAQSPDDREFSDYLSAARRGVRTFWVGRKLAQRQERSDEILAALSEKAGHAAFDVGELEGCLRWVKEQFHDALGGLNHENPGDLPSLFISAVNAINRGESEKFNQILPLLNCSQDARIRSVSQLFTSYLEAEKARHSGNAAVALHGYEVSIEICRSEPQLASTLTHLNLKVAQCYLLMHDGPRARIAWSKAARHGSNNVEPRDRAELASTEGWLLLRELRFSEASERFREALEFSTSLHDHGASAHQSLGWGHAMAALNQLGEAADLYRKAVDLYSLCRDDKGVGMGLSSLSVVLQHAVPFQADDQTRAAMEEESRGCYTTAIKLLMATNSTEAAMAMTSRALILFDQGHAESAKTLIEQALQLCTDQNLSHLRPIIDQVSGNILNQSGDR